MDRRVDAAIWTLRARPEVDGGKIALLGWCLGGRAALRAAVAVPLTRTTRGVLAAAAFHGVFTAEDVADSGDLQFAPRLLACHGADDPFVPDFDRVAHALRKRKAPYDTHVFANARHGFTNPAQCLNENPAFAYDQPAAEASWALTERLLNNAFAGPTTDDNENNSPPT